jgi:hypothetical protein
MVKEMKVVDKKFSGVIYFLEDDRLELANVYEGILKKYYD